MTEQYSHPENWIMYALSVIFVGVGLLVLYLVGQTATLKCIRAGETQSQCTLTTTWMKLSRLKEVTFSPLVSATTEESCDDDGCTYRVLLLSSTGSLPLTSVYSSGYESKQKIADQINAYVQNTDQKSLEIETNSGFWIIAPFVFIVIGIFFGLRTFISSMRS
jgi:hypothetical protein